MSARIDVATALRAEPELCAKLGRLSSGIGESGLSQERADALLARVAWSRIAEPGDGSAGALISVLGAGGALRALVDGASPRRIGELARAAGVEIAERTIAEGLARWRPRLDRVATIGDVDRALAARMSAVAPGDPAWPEGALGDLGPHAPTVLWLRGDPSLLTAPSLSVVGARAATGYGTHITAEIVDGVCRQGVVIVSGAAYGIDAVAHRTALAAEGRTVAVLAGGADRHYPAAHDSLLERIAREGLVCAEMIPGAAPTRWRFRMRNRIIAALSPATLVTEAGLRSGTLNTAGHAAELGRSLGAVPGPVTSAASAGCHKLIREYGAALVTNAREVCELLGLDDRLDLFGDDPEAGEAAIAAGGSRTPPRQERVLDALPLRGGRALDEIAARAGLGRSETRGALAELELLGRVRRCETPGEPEPKWALPRAQ